MEVSPGEEKEISVNLVYRPSTIDIGERWDPKCGVWLDDVLLGTVAKVKRQVVVNNPDRAHKLMLSCDGEKFEQRYKFLGPSRVEFRPEAP